MRQPKAATSADRWRTVQFLIHLPRLIRLYWRLLWDGRVPVWLKLMLLGAVAYVVFPFDLIPDVIPVLGELDDLVVLIVAARWFLEWCPPAVVAEHVRALGGR
jgi:uncharacterized membrane protein YkvA (DUF1232 family)